jgi:serine/threonine-protein kinase HipA
MSQRANVLNNGRLAGVLEKTEAGEYVFTYDRNYRKDPATSAISLTLPKTQPSYRSSTLFPFFFGLLSEGANKQTQCRLLRIDERDHFSLLLKTAHSDTIGSVVIQALSR